jgi:hypothetical protein
LTLDDAESKVLKRALDELQQSEGVQDGHRKRHRDDRSDRLYVRFEVDQLPTS